MSTTRPYPPGDRGPEPSGASGAPEGASKGDGVPVSSQGRQVRRLSLAGAAGVVPMARDFARQALYAWGWLPAE
ncbi:MAG TPA: ATP-binding protein, partial [Streptomyces sp.]|nr:ATP-binding protein [Streptomyces sp.]